MNEVDRELDEFGKQALAPLRTVPPIEPQTSAEIKKHYLVQSENLRLDLLSQSNKVGTIKIRQKPTATPAYAHTHLIKTFAAVLLALLVFLVGSSITVYAAQSSLPGEPLYTVKSWSEDVRLSVTFSTRSKLNLTLDYTNRRVNEIASMVAGGEGISSQATDRYQDELNTALQLVTQLDDSQMNSALELIKKHAVNQGMTIDELISTLPPQAEPAIIRLQQRLEEQVQWSQFGEKDPQAFRVEIRGRIHEQHGPKHNQPSDQSGSSTDELIGTPSPDKGGHGNDQKQPSGVPNHGSSGNGQNQGSPGNNDHEPNPQRTPEP